MSSIHSQASDTLPQETQAATPPAQQQQYNRGKTPAIREENEEEEDGDASNDAINRDDKPSPKANSTRSSSSSNAVSSSNGGKSMSTITFEKQKVVPPRARTHSAQSVLSTISLQPMFHQHAHQNQQQSQQPQQTNEDQRNLSCTNLARINQQIQSPAMSSIRKKGVTNSVTSGRISDEDLEIGLRLPFTDDKRLYLDANSVKQRQQQKQKQLQKKDNASVKTNGSTVVENEEVEEDDVVMQKRLTAQALRKLSNLRGSSTMGVGINQALINNDNNNNSNNGNNNSLSYGDGDGRTIDEGSQDLEAMTHLKFGNKKVFLDSFPQGSNNNNNYYSSNNNNNNNNNVAASLVTQQPSLQSIRKASLEVIQQPGQQLNTQQKVGVPPTSGTTPTNASSRRCVKQINNPKKPLYLPAVLRDVSETNLTNEDFVRPPSPPQSLVSNNQTITSRNLHQQAQHSSQNTSASSTASIHSSSSSVMESCRRQIALWFFPNGEYSSMENRWSQLLDPPAPPTKRHWLHDNKRGSCHYCHKLFTFWERKHHCRHCGDIFCQQHLGHWLYLNSDASFIIGGGGLGTLSKICDGCLEEYENVVKNPKWKSQKLGNFNQHGGLVEPTRAAAAAATPPKNVEGINVQNDDSKGDFIGSVAGSVPADWNWSSF
ncbi:hypothetical protein ZYGR_0AD01690 [Zygosaccharomyces rouxii]|uniref:ZYRO0G09856p n=2 Tax=Zygosaccharomyces rouxii TaxID=4956 RepID=C5E053_ZYGRC|nr:uncharacterized protein ZYRO0G09856g [Zygosaccharomyces rouxii]KAH9202482.1 hypothetical protein LQ764DRAFT_232649 [Zygosaccharomyces rouxii]GAV50986.1 hypothetical protein ZYGR_0AD01690 [Zygosaccharomyces rouxii]CAR29487.1 ZYRO0G09856p [Zygosaccharomyces rouxii]